MQRRKKTEDEYLSCNCKVFLRKYFVSLFIAPVPVGQSQDVRGQSVSVSESESGCQSAENPQRFLLTVTVMTVRGDNQ